MPNFFPKCVQRELGMVDRLDARARFLAVGTHQHILAPRHLSRTDDRLPLWSTKVLWPLDPMTEMVRPVPCSSLSCLMSAVLPRAAREERDEAGAGRHIGEGPVLHAAMEGS